ncbi:MAG: FecR domain-containing protein [Ignavibacteria bacterium]|jgi:ferric-dicitrate binding protein FerR (iron transport regulator)
MDKLPKNIDYQFLVRVLNDEISPEEREFFESWLSESEKNREDFGAITLLWDKIGSAKSPTPADPELQWSKISERVAKIRNEKTKIISLSKERDKIQSKLIHYQRFHSQVRRRMLESNFIKAAAAITFAVVTGLLLSINPPVPETTGRHIAKKEIYHAKTRRGEKITLTLSDGSKVYINNDSKFTYPRMFDKDSRQVELEGEAYFSVVRDESRPFSVKSGNTITVVRGTEFNIKNRGNSVSVVVAKGSVDTYTPDLDKKYNLKKGDMILYNTRSGFSEPKKVNLRQYLAWRNDKLAFTHTPLSEVMDEIERYYNVKVIFESELHKDKTITGIFETDSIDHILSIIALTLDIDIERVDKKIMVKNYQEQNIY